LDHHFLDSNGQVWCAILTIVPSSQYMRLK
jgi:hypothetical protein